jgi:hypothetical protein
MGRPMEHGHRARTESGSGARRVRDTAHGVTSGDAPMVNWRRGEHRELAGSSTHPQGKVECTRIPQTERAREGGGSPVTWWWRNGGSRRRDPRGALSGPARL